MEGRRLQWRLRGNVQSAAARLGRAFRLAPACLLPHMIRFVKAHAYGNDFLYVRQEDVQAVSLDALAREMCERHTGVGADGLIAFRQAPGGGSMVLFNADGSRAEVSGNGVRGLAALIQIGRAHV